MLALAHLRPSMIASVQVTVIGNIASTWSRGIIPCAFTSTCQTVGRSYHGERWMSVMNQEAIAEITGDTIRPLFTLKGGTKLPFDLLHGPLFLSHTDTRVVIETN